MKSNKFWVYLIGVMLLVSCVAAAAVYLSHGSGHIVGIYQNGEPVKRIHLDTVTTPYQITIEADGGGYNVISVEQGRICVSAASCPDHVCVETGWLCDGAIPIVCLPNRLVIQLESGNNNIDVAVQ